MKDSRERILFKLCTAIGIASLVLTLADFFFLKKARVFTNYRPINEHYGNEILPYYLVATLLAGVLLFATRKDSRRQALLAWGVSFAFFSNQFTHSKWPEVIVFSTGLILLACGARSSAAIEPESKL